MNKTLCVLEFDLSLEMYIQAARIALRLFIKAKLSSKGITEALECTKLSSQIPVNVAQNLSTISTIGVQPLRHVVCAGSPFPSSLGPCLHGVSSNYTYKPFNVAAAHRRPSYTPLWNKPTGLGPGGPTLGCPTCPASPGLLPGPKPPHAQGAAA